MKAVGFVFLFAIILFILNFMKILLGFEDAVFGALAYIIVLLIIFK